MNKEFTYSNIRLCDIFCHLTGINVAHIQSQPVTVVAYTNDISIQKLI